MTTAPRYAMKLIVVLFACFVASCLMVSGVLYEEVTRVGAGLGFLVMALIVQNVGSSSPKHREHQRD